MKVQMTPEQKEKQIRKDIQGVKGIILNKIVMKSFSEKLIFEERPERNIS